MTEPRCLVAMYHYVRDVEKTPFPALRALSTADFVAQLGMFAECRPPIEYQTFERYLRGRRPVERPCSLLTFDDGFVDHYETVFPLLRRHSWTAVFFVAGEAVRDEPRVLNVHKIHFLIAHLGQQTFARAIRERLVRQPVAAGESLTRVPEVYRYDGVGDLEIKHLLNYELPHEVADGLLGDLFAEHLGDEAAFARKLYLSRAQILEMARAGMIFGFHTERHRVLSRLDRSAQRLELAQGVARVHGWTGQASVPFCYPYGHSHTFDATTLDLLEEIGYGSAFTTKRRLSDPSLDGRYEVPRYDTRDLPPFVPVFPNA